MTTDAEVATAVAYIARHSQAGLAPAVNWYEATCTANGCRSLAYLRKHYDLRCVDLVLLAGMEPRGGMARTMASRRSRPGQRRMGVPDEVEDQVEQEERHRTGWRDPHGRTWVGTPDGWYSPTLPVCAMREESFTGRTPDGDPVAVSRIYYSLR